MLIKCSSVILCFLLLTIVNGISIKEKFMEQSSHRISNGGGSIGLKPVAVVGGESVAPRNALKSPNIVFDENGAAFPVAPTPSTAAVLG